MSLITLWKEIIVDSRGERRKWEIPKILKILSWNWGMMVHKCEEHAKLFNMDMFS